MKHILCAGWLIGVGVALGACAGAKVYPAVVPAQVKQVRPYPELVPFPNHPGWFYPPSPERAVRLDLRGFPSGTEIKSPTTGLYYRVP